MVEKWLADFFCFPFVSHAHMFMKSCSMFVSIIVYFNALWNCSADIVMVHVTGHYDELFSLCAILLYLYQFVHKNPFPCKAKKKRRRALQTFDTCVYVCASGKTLFFLAFYATAGLPRLFCMWFYDFPPYNEHRYQKARESPPQMPYRKHIVAVCCCSHFMHTNPIWLTGPPKNGRGFSARIARRWVIVCIYIHIYYTYFRNVQWDWVNKNPQREKTKSTHSQTIAYASGRFDGQRGKWWTFPKQYNLPGPRRPGSQASRSEKPSSDQYHLSTVLAHRASVKKRMKLLDCFNPRIISTGTGSIFFSMLPPQGWCTTTDRAAYLSYLCCLIVFVSQPRGASSLTPLRDTLCDNP